MSAPLVGALVSYRAQRAMGARCLCFGTALQTHSKPSSVPLATRTGYSAAWAVQAKNGISTCTNWFYGTAPVCNMIFFLNWSVYPIQSIKIHLYYTCRFDHWSHYVTDCNMNSEIYFSMFFIERFVVCKTYCIISPLDVKSSFFLCGIINNSTCFCPQSPGSCPQDYRRMKLNLQIIEYLQFTRLVK